MRDDRERLLDVLEAIERINKYASRGREEFDRDELVQTWTVHYLQTIGEACRAVSESLKSAHPEVPWFQISGMRNILVHEYFAIDEEVVWAVVENDLPKSKNNMTAILEDLQAS